MKTIAELFSPAERAEMQAAADRITAESQRLTWERENGKNEQHRALVLTLAAVTAVAIALSLIAEWLAVF